MLLATRLRALDAQIDGLRVLRATVAQLHEETATGDPDLCGADQVCRYLQTSPSPRLRHTLELAGVNRVFDLAAPVGSHHAPQAAG